MAHLKHITFVLPVRGQSSNAYPAIVLRLKLYKNDAHFKPNDSQSMIIWASIIGASLCPLLDSKVKDDAVNQAIEIWPHIFSEEFNLDLKALSVAFRKYMRELVSLKMGYDLSLLLRTSFELGNDADIADKLNELIAGNTEFWPSIFRRFGYPETAEV